MTEDTKSAAAAPAPESAVADTTGAALPISPESDEPVVKPAGKLVSAESIAPAPAPPAATVPTAPSATPPAAAKAAGAPATAGKAAGAAAGHKKDAAKSLKPERPTQRGALIIDEAIEIAAPVENVWRFFLNFVKWPAWCPVVRGVKSVVPGTAFGLGWRFELRVKCGPFPLRFQAIVLENNTPNVIRWMGSFTGVHGMHWWFFEKAEAGTRVTSYEEVTGPLRILALVMRPLTRRMMRTWLGALKTAVEAQASKDKKSPPLKAPE